MDSHEWRFPMPCPSCQATAGDPYRATPEADLIRVSLRCAACGHTWEITGVSASPLLYRKPDRRLTRRAG